jgi:carbonic anhydrase/acetyltransferase-like protein (isoleucine patch superfamily)
MGRHLEYSLGMPVYALGDLVPRIHETAFVHPDAVVIGDVTIGAECSIWPSAVLRADEAPIIIGDRTSIQDGSVVHSAPDLPTVVAEDCLVGHLAHLEGCRIEARGFIGSGAMVLHRALIGEGALVAANAVVLADVHVPAGALATGVPATIREGAANKAMVGGAAEFYVAETARYRRSLRRLD